eukprot:7293878-Alexandrium_andersonii.AAC.1
MGGGREPGGHQASERGPTLAVVPPRGADAQAPLVGSHAWAAESPPPGPHWLSAPLSPQGAFAPQRAPAS